MPTVKTPLAPGQAAFVLETLILEGVVRRSQVDRVAATIPDFIARTQARLDALRGITPDQRERRRRAGSVAPVSPQVAASRRLQGEYMGLLRHAPPSIKAKAQRIASTESRQRAVAFLRSVLPARS